jgi:hypothetical protein
VSVRQGGLQGCRAEQDVHVTLLRLREGGGQDQGNYFMPEALRSSFSPILYALWVGVPFPAYQLGAAQLPIEWLWT